MWEMLNNDDANGVITMYEVCYKASDTPTDINCDSKKSVNGDTREVVLSSLNEATTYNVAVQGETSQGFGPLGNIMTNKTLEASEYILLPNYHFIELFLVVAGLEVRNKGKGRINGLDGEGGGGGRLFGRFHSSIFSLVWLEVISFIHLNF